MDPQSQWSSRSSTSTPPPGYAEPERQPQPSPFGRSAPEPQGSPFGNKTKRGGGLLVALGALLAKFKGVLLLLPKLKLLVTSGSMLVSIAAYSLIWGWTFAVGFVALLFVHEMGHVIQLRREGIKASAPMFIPFMGAFVAAKSLGENALAEARVGLAGPVLGSAAAAALIPVWQATGNEFWQALAFTGLFLNLFNLLPVLPLDGGRAMAAMAPWMWFLGFGAMVFLALRFPNPIIFIILLFGLMETWRRWKALRSGDRTQQAYYKVSPRNRLIVAAVYVGLIGLLAYGMYATHLVRHLPA